MFSENLSTKEIHYNSNKNILKFVLKYYFNFQNM